MTSLSRTILNAAAITLLVGCSSAQGPTPPSKAQSRLPQATVELGQLGPPDPVGITAEAAQSAMGDKSLKAKLHDLALGVASVSGASSPKTMHAVGVSDRQAAQAVLSGAIINDHRPVYVIKMTGGPFTATHHRPGAAAPQGNVLTLTVDAATYRVTDIGYVSVEPELSLMGPVDVDLMAP